MKKLKRYALLFLKGLSMGTADVVPSISSGTIALIMGIYSELIIAIRSFNKTAFKLLITGKWKQFWYYIHGSFLLPLGLGIMLSLLTTAHLVRYLLARYPIEIESFFLGLSIISSIVVYQQIKKFNFLLLLISVLGAFVAYLIIQIDPLAVSLTAPWFIFISGGLAVCAMILPGISGSFILLILGAYNFMLDALENFNWPILAIFMLGGVVGLLIFSKALSFLLHNYADCTIALLAGFMIGAIPRIWPWKTFIPGGGNMPTHILLEKNISPMHFQYLYQKDPRILQALFFISLGCLLVILLNKLGSRKYL